MRRLTTPVPRRLVPVGLALLLLPAGPAALAEPGPGAPPVQAFPSPGSRTVAPGSQLSFRGTTDLRSVQVRGSVTGPHPGRVVEHSDGRGASFVPAQPFAPGEELTVRSALLVAGAAGGALHYTVSRPVAVAPERLQAVEQGAAAAPAVTAAPDAAARPGPYRSRPDLRPPTVQVKAPGPHAPGLLFASSGVPTSTADTGVLIYDDRGEPVWFNPLPPTGLGTLSRIRYRGQDALTWFTGTQAFVGGFKGTWIVADTGYHQIGEIAAGNGLTADGHELRISADGTKALLDIYNPVQVDLSRQGGRRDATVYEAVVQEVDLGTGAVTFEWHSLDDSPVTDTYEALGTPEVDYFHLNAMEYDGDRILVSGRHVSQALQLTRDAGTDGHVAWRLGGRRSTYRFAQAGNAPSYPHDVRRRPDGTLSLYDNGVQRNPPYGRGVAYRLDAKARTARAVRTWDHDRDLFGIIVGSNRLLDNGDQLVSYGSSGVATEYAPGGGRVWESRLGPGAWTYRTLRVAGWHAEPAEAPALVTRERDGRVTGWVSWNGATDVATWTLLAGPSAADLHPVGAATRRSGFETTVSGTVTAADRVLVAEARDAAGRVLRRSTGADTATPIRAHYNSLGGPDSFLGAPTTPETTLPDGVYQRYEHGAIYYSAATRAWEVHGDVQAAWDRVGAQAGPLGYPTTDERELPDRLGRFNLFAGGSVYWTAATGAHEVHGLIQAKWSGLGSQSGFLGYPLTDELVARDGAGRVSVFQGGSVYSSPGVGTSSVRGLVRDHWYALGAETGVLGYPIADEEATRGGDGRVSRFQQGGVHWSSGTGAFAVQGRIADHYDDLGEEGGRLGFPLTDELTTPGGAGRYNTFQGGSVYWSPASGAAEVQGELRDAWGRLGYEAGLLGFPTTDERGTRDGVGRYNEFQGGVAYWSPATGAHEVHGSLLAAWLDRGAEHGSLGYPVSDEYAVPGGRRSDFANGSLVWDAATGQVRVLR